MRKIGKKLADHLEEKMMKPGDGSLSKNKKRKPRITSFVPVNLGLKYELVCGGEVKLKARKKIFRSDHILHLYPSVVSFSGRL